MVAAAAEINVMEIGLVQVVLTQISPGEMNVIDAKSPRGDQVGGAWVAVEVAAAVVVVDFHAAVASFPIDEMGRCEVPIVEMIVIAHTNQIKH